MSDRYTIHEEVGRGGMGRVLRVRDEDLHRDLAMKVMQTDGLAPGSVPTRPSMMTTRFVEEAQVGGQLDHPGIVPVHEMGLDREGRFYFTMKLVRGRTLEKILGIAREGQEGWSLTRILHVLLRVCEAMSYAHERGVLHRDLKPANIMLGDHGEVYVMDWGLARLIGQAERETRSADGESGSLHSARSGGSAAGASSPFVTEADRVVGTPSFMSPEQSAGAGADLTQQSDVYSAGAILYAALTGRAPYSDPGKRVDNRAVWLALQQGPPVHVTELAPRVAPELVSICEKAMARSLGQRYPTMKALADDLRAFLELRVVHAHRTGPWHEFKKWVVRNKVVAGALLIVCSVTSIAGFTIAASERARARESELRADVGESATLLDAVDHLGPIHPYSLDNYDDWLARARRLIATRPAREAEQAARAAGADATEPRAPDLNAERAVSSARSIIDELEDDLGKAKDPEGKPSTPELDEARAVALETHPEEIRWRTRKLQALEAAIDRSPVLRFTDRKLQTAANEGHRLLRNLRELESVVPLVADRAERARQLHRRTVEDEAPAWDAAIASIRDPSQCPLYAGLQISRQVGLVPLRRDPASGLWEFWHVLSGERPLENGHGGWKLTPNSGAVLVLIPGGSATMGAQRADPSQPRHDPDADSPEAPRSARLDAYFISKYELTQGQWLWLDDEAPSKVVVGMKSKFTPRTTRQNPVESVDWIRCEHVLARVGLVLPTELQWEWAARGGTLRRFLTTDDMDEAAPGINFGDRTLQKAMRLKELTGPDDGFAGHVRVDAFQPNGFGLYQVLGNVSEWCRDWYADSQDPTMPRDGDGEILARIRMTKSVRGGSFLTQWRWTRVSGRSQKEPNGTGQDLGVRPARALER